MKYFPIKFHVAYIIITLLISFYGPRLYLDYEFLPVSIFIFFYLIAVTTGFYMGFNSKVKITRTKLNNEFLTKLFKYSLYITIILFFLNTIYQFSIGSLSFDVGNMGGNYGTYYQNYYEKKEQQVFTIELLFLVIAAIPKFITLSLGFFLLDQLPRKYKIYFFSTIFMIVLTQTISSGNQKSIGDIFIIGAIVAGIKIYKLKPQKRREIIRKLLILSFFFFILLSYSQYSRLSARSITIFELNQLMSDYSHYDIKHPIFTIFGYEIGLGVSTFVTGYLSGGYYGLSKCMELPFEWTYGIGNSVALSSISDMLFGTNIYSGTYLYRMDEAFGIPGKRAWHTAFPWLASDLSWWGVPPFFMMVSYFYGKSWKESLVYNNPISFLLFSLLSIMFVFIVANNQIMHGYDYLSITFFVVILYIFKHKNFNIKYLKRN